MGRDYIYGVGEPDKLIREFTIKKPVAEKILVSGSLPSGENPFKDTPIDISNDMIYSKLEEKLNLKATSWLDGFIEIACDNTDEEIKQCLIDLNLEYVEPVRTQPVCENTDKDGRKTVPDDFTLTTKERETIRKAIETKQQE